MSDVKFIDSFCGNVFDNYEDAVKSAKRHSIRGKMDVPIYKTIAIARYPFPDIKIDVLEETAPTST